MELFKGARSRTAPKIVYIILSETFDFCFSTPPNPLYSLIKQHQKNMTTISPTKAGREVRGVGERKKGKLPRPKRVKGKVGNLFCDRTPQGNQTARTNARTKRNETISRLDCPPTSD